MLKTVFKMLAGAFLFAMIASAIAAIGFPPIANNFALPDGTWLNGLAAGQNFSYQYGLTAAGTNQATATVVPSAIYLVEVDTSGSGGATGIALPPCAQGVALNVLNNTAYTIDVYPSAVNNPATNAQDVIITAGSAGTTSTSMTLYTGKTFSCAKNGTWLGK